MHRTGRVLASLLAVAVLLQVIVLSAGVASAEPPTTWALSYWGPADYRNASEVDILVTSSLYAVSALDSNRAWAVGLYSDTSLSGALPFVAYTADGGSSWATSKLLAYSAMPTLRGVYAVDSTHVWAVGNSGLILKWDGTSWVRQAAGVTGANLHAVSFVDVSNGWAVGAGGTILRTTDGGSSWTTSPSGTPNDLNGVSAVSATVAHAVGVGGTARRWNGTIWDSATSGTGSTLRSVAFIDATHGWAVGDSNTFLVWNGSQWSASAPVRAVWGPDDAKPQSVSFSDALNGIAAGETSMVWRTNDGGVHWTVSQLPYGVMVQLRGTATTPGDTARVWAVGDNQDYASPCKAHVYAGVLELTAPAAPSGLSALSGAPGPRTELTWTDNSIDEQGFVVERAKDSPSGFSSIATLGVNSASYVDATGLDWTSTWYYRVRAYNAAGDSAYAGPVSIKHTQPPGTLSGTVTRASDVTPLPGVAVTVGGVYSTTTGAGGTYSVASIPPGTYSVVYTLAGYGTRTEAGVVINNGATTNLSVTLTVTPAPVLVPVHRFYNWRTGTHFYTASEAEKASVIGHTDWPFTYEGVAYTLNASNPANSSPLHRFYNRRTGTHFYTASEAEMKSVIGHTDWPFTYEGVAYYVSKSPTGSLSVHRFYNWRTGTHFYTASEAEKDSVIGHTDWPFTYEGVGFYVAP